MIAAAALFRFGISGGLALAGDARGMKVPDTEEQEDWVDGYEQRFTDL